MESLKQAIRGTPPGSGFGREGHGQDLADLGGGRGADCRGDVLATTAVAVAPRPPRISAHIEQARDQPARRRRHSARFDRSRPQHPATPQWAYRASQAV